MAWAVFVSSAGHLWPCGNCALSSAPRVCDRVSDHACCSRSRIWTAFRFRWHFPCQFLFDRSTFSGTRLVFLLGTVTHLLFGPCSPIWSSHLACACWHWDLITSSFAPKAHSSSEWVVQLSLFAVYASRSGFLVSTGARGATSQKSPNWACFSFYWVPFAALYSPASSRHWDAASASWLTSASSFCASPVPKQSCFVYLVWKISTTLWEKSANSYSPH